ncbi:MAG: quinolinate synthase NadA [Lentimicrobiaceae bacterium]|nr:quinolinate synthase NadA [Lentimicrobiaceae bacterium]
MNSKELIRKINKLRKEKNAIILAHYYQIGEIQDIADFTGDSLQLAQVAAQNDAEIILFAGVHFMAETAKTLSPNKKVILPDLKTGCSLALSAPTKKFVEFKKQHPDHKVVSYINCTAEMKTHTDVVCTSSNAVDIVNSFPKEQPLIFAPDKNLGSYVNKVTGRNMLLWDGACHVHDRISADILKKLIEKHPDAQVIAHPESREEVLNLANFIGSTAKMIDYVSKSDTETFIVVTETGILHKMKQVAPNKKYILASKDENNTNNCEFMKLNTLENVYECLLNESPEIILSDHIIENARKPIIRMLELSK